MGDEAKAWQAGIGGVAGSIIGSIAGNIGSKRRQKRADAVNLANWHRQNAYNHPLEQMARLKQAGLNPNLIYGQGGGSQQVGDVSPSKAADYKMDTGDPIGKYYMAKSTEAQVNNVRLMNEQIQEQILLTKANTLKIQAEEAEIKARTPGYTPSIKKSTVEADAIQQITDYSLEAKGIDIDQQKQTLAKSTLEVGILQSTQESIIENAAQTLRNLKAQGANIQAGTAKLKVEKEIQDMIKAALPAGTKPGDAWIYRKVQQIYNRARDLALKAHKTIKAQKKYNPIPNKKY